MTRLTIIMPTYNGERFLRPQIESILAQSDPDFELVTIDDGSTDTSVAIVDDYTRRDKRVRRVQSTGNRGQVRRLAEVLHEASTELVAIADQDDVWHPERNARLIEALGDRAIAFGRSQLMDAQGVDLGRSILDSLEIRADVGPLEALFQPLVSAHAAIVRRQWIDPAALFRLMEFDRLMGLEALFSAGLIYVDDAIVHHRLHGTNQHNGALANARPRQRLLSRQRARQSVSFVRSGRLDFYLAAEQLSKSRAIPSSVARTFSGIAFACHNCWYFPWNAREARNDRLRAMLHEQLDPFASSPRDLAFFRQQVNALTRAQFAPSAMWSAAMRYTGPR